MARVRTSSGSRGHTVSQAVSRWLHRLRRLMLTELGLLAEAQLMLLYCQLMRWQRPVGRLIRIESGQSVSEPSRSVAVSAARISWAITRATRYGVFRPQCLVRALALQKMLKRRGIESSQLRIGVRLDGGVFQAHAWVELNGLTLGDTAQHISTFTQTSELGLVQR